MNEVKVGQTYLDRTTRKGSNELRSVRVIAINQIEVGGEGPVAHIINTKTLRRVKITTARLLDKSRFELVSEIGNLAPVPYEGREVAA